MNGLFKLIRQAVQCLLSCLLQHMELEVLTCQRELWLVIEYKKPGLSSDTLPMVVKSSHLAGYGLEAS